MYNLNPNFQKIKKNLIVNKKFKITLYYYFLPGITYFDLSVLFQIMQTIPVLYNENPLEVAMAVNE
jgi:hypothetical protein